MNIKKYMFLSMLIVISLLLATNNGQNNIVYAEGNGTSNVSVSISAQTWIDIAPDKVRWESVNPGAKSTTFKDLETDIVGIEGFNIRNIGSNVITRVWFNASYPSATNNLYEEIYNTNDLSKYDTGNFISLSRADCNGNPDNKLLCGTITSITDDDYFYPNKVEYAEAMMNSSNKITNGSMIPYLNITRGKNLTMGRIRDGKNEYFWAIYTHAGTGFDCSESTSGNPPKLRLGKIPHNDTNIGTIDLRETGYGSNTIAEDIGTVDFGSSADRLGLTLSEGRWINCGFSVSSDCRSITVLQWNKDEGLSTNDYNYWVTTSAGSTGKAHRDITGAGVLPGEYYTTWAYLQLPYGVPDGTMIAGTLTVLAT